MHCLDLSSRIRVSPRGTGGAPVDHTVLTACLYACPPVRLSACSPHIFPPRKTIKGDLLTFSLLASYPCSGDGLAGQGSAFRGLGYSVQTGRPEVYIQPGACWLIS
ncbi:unnamed protein product [Protopolystoma xenopodis]|uniref:Uncharacterized protein n=1 Tax=Protopolystoma xenopodis TaxID=117903 RepID=A0A448XPR7_9PLAT|nr:unnamed protein product [Protopolystoma xenopodis]